MFMLGTTLKRALLVALLAVVAVMSAFSVTAQTYTDAMGTSVAEVEAAPYTTDPRKALSISAAAAAAVHRLIGALENQISQIVTGGAFNGAGAKILAVLGTIVVIWSILKNMVLKPGLTQIVADLVFPAVIIGLGMMALNSNFASMVATSVESLGSALGTASSASGGSRAQIFATNMIESAAKMWQVSPPVNLVDLGLTYLASLALQVVALAFLMLGTAIGLGVLFMAKFQVALALALAPVMIPWLLWKPTEFIFSGWLNFLIKGAFIQVAVFAIEGTIRSSVQGMGALAGTAAPGVDSAMLFGAIALMAMLFAFLLLKAAEIGAGIVSGSVSGFGGFQAISSGATAGALKGMARGTAGAISGAAGLGKAYQMGKSVKGLQDNQLSSLQQSLQPQKNSLNRVAYEMGRRAEPKNAAAAQASTASTPSTPQNAHTQFQARQQQRATKNLSKLISKLKP